MTLKRRLAIALAMTLSSVALLLPASAQETDEPEVTPASDTEKKPGFWGNRFALYLETSVGAASSDPVSTTVFTLDNLGALNALTLDDQENARFTAGWQLPEGRGMFLITWEGFKETEWSFRGRGVRPTLSGTSRQAADLLEWWNVGVSGGVLTSSAQTPTWIEVQDDANGNRFPDADEIRILPSMLGTTRSTVDNLQNRMQTVDAMYTRPFGGRWINATWGVGLRHYVYEGNLPVAAWLLANFIRSPSEGFTEGANLRLLSFYQETTGFGPTGMVELRLNFMRERLVLYWVARSAFVISDLESDSGNFFTLVRNETTRTVFPIDTRLVETRSKDVWQTGAEGGVRVRLAEGLKLHLAYHLSAYQDVVLLPSRIAIPENLGQAPQGTTALYRTRDIRLDGWRGGFSFQF